MSVYLIHYLRVKLLIRSSPVRIILVTLKPLLESLHEYMTTFISFLLLVPSTKAHRLTLDISYSTKVSLIERTELFPPG